MKVFIHIGLHKTGTTFLQKQVFPYIEDIHYVEKEESIRFDMNLNEKKVNLISNEDLSGNPWLKNVHDRFRIADRLKRVFPKAKIIVGTRNKSSWVKSLYKNYVRKGGIYDFKTFKNDIFEEDYLEFDEYINYLKKLFDDVYVYQFEDLKKDSFQFVKDMCEYIGCSVPSFDNQKRNVAWNDRQLRLARFLNKFWYHKYFNEKGVIHDRSGLPNPRFIVSLFNGGEK